MMMKIGHSSGRLLGVSILVLGVFAVGPLRAQKPQETQGPAKERELEPKVEVILGPGTVVFIAAILEGEEDADDEMLPVRYDARFVKIRTRCAENSAKGCLETHLSTIGFPMTYEPQESPCGEPMAIEGVRFDGRELRPTKAPRGSRHKRRTSWYAAGFSVEKGATVLAAYRCPEGVVAAAGGDEAGPGGPP